MTIPPMTSEEAAAFLKGVEWMRERCGAFLIRMASDEDHDPDGSADRAVAYERSADGVRAIPAPTVPRLGFGVLGEG